MLTTTLKKTYADKKHEHVPCPLCGAEKDTVLATRGYPGIPVQNVICRGCGLIRIDPRMTPEGYADFYQEDFFEYLNPFSRPAYIEEIEHTTDDSYETPSKRLILPYIRDYVKEGGHVLDVGAGFGQMLYILSKQKGVSFVGLEPDPGSRSLAKEKIGIDLKDMLVEQFLETDTGTFDFIFMEQVFEHLLSPLDTLTKLAKILKQEGVIYIGVPNAYDPQVPMALFYQLAHTYNYTPATLRKFADKAGLKVISVRDPLGTPLEVLLAHRDSSYAEEKEERMQQGSDWQDVARRLKRKQFINTVRGAGKHVANAVLGANGKEKLRSALDRITGYRY